MVLVADKIRRQFYAQKSVVDENISFLKHDFDQAIEIYFN